MNATLVTAWESTFHFCTPLFVLLHNSPSFIEVLFIDLWLGRQIKSTANGVAAMGLEELQHTPCHALASGRRMQEGMWGILGLWENEAQVEQFSQLPGVKASTSSTRRLVGLDQNLKLATEKTLLKSEANECSPLPCCLCQSLCHPWSGSEGRCTCPQRHCTHECARHQCMAKP